MHWPHWMVRTTSRWAYLSGPHIYPAQNRRRGRSGALATPRIRPVGESMPELALADELFVVGDDEYGDKPRV